MNLWKISLPALLLGLTVSATVAAGQDTGARRPQSPKPCYTPAGSMTCPPGAGVDVVSVIPALIGQKPAVRLPGRTSIKPNSPVRRFR